MGNDIYEDGSLMAFSRRMSFPDGAVVSFISPGCSTRPPGQIFSLYFHFYLVNCPIHETTTSYALYQPHLTYCYPIIVSEAVQVEID